MSKFFPESTRMREFEDIQDKARGLGSLIDQLKGLYQNEMPITQAEVDAQYEMFCRAKARSGEIFKELDSSFRKAVKELEER